MGSWSACASIPGGRRLQRGISTLWMSTKSSSSVSRIKSWQKKVSTLQACIASLNITIINGWLWALAISAPGSSDVVDVQREVGEPDWCTLILAQCPFQLFQVVSNKSIETQVLAQKTADSKNLFPWSICYLRQVTTDMQQNISTCVAFYGARHCTIKVQRQQHTQEGYQGQNYWVDPSRHGKMAAIKLSKT